MFCPQEVVQSVRTTLNDAKVTNSNLHPSTCMDISKKKKKKKKKTYILIVSLKGYLNIHFFHTFVLKNMDTCRNSKHSLRQNSAYIYIYIYIYMIISVL
jgi:hypothetical protein